MMEGRQYVFTTETVWKSGFKPELGMVVDVELAQDGSVAAVRGIPQSQLTEEQTACGARRSMTESRRDSCDAGELGVANLIAAGILLGAWFMLSAAAIKTPVGRVNVTFWQLLGILHSNAALDGLMQGEIPANPGLYGLGALVSLAGPFLHYAWNDRRAFLMDMLPLAFLLAVGIVLRNDALDNLRAAGNHGIADAAGSDSSSVILIAAGYYVSVLASLFLAGNGLRRFLAARPRRNEGQKPFRAAA